MLFSREGGLTQGRCWPPDLQTFHDQMTAKGVRFPIAPKKQEYGGVLARFEDSEGASVTVNGKQGDRQD